MEPVSIHVVVSPVAEGGQSFDIVALHGLGGSWDTSWTTEDGYNWLCSLLAVKRPSARVLSLHCPQLLLRFNTDEPNVSDLVEAIIDERENSGRSDVPLVLIGHSFGGSLLKQLYIATDRERDAPPDYQALHDLIRGFIFFGTPHRSLTHDDYGALFRLLFRESTTSLGGTATDLEDAFTNLTRLNTDFRQLNGEELPACCFYEKQKSRIGLEQAHVVPQEKALYLTKPVHNNHLDLRHQDLVRISGNQQNRDTRRVMSGIEKLFHIIESPAVDRETIGGKKPKGLSLLCLDGGGIRGYFSILVLQKVLDEASTLADEKGAKRLPHEYFDLIGGTSTGGLIAIMLGRLQMDMASCIKAYRELSGKIFSVGTGLNALVTSGRMVAGLLTSGHPYYSGESLKNAICETIRDQLDRRERESLEAAGLSFEDVRLLSPEAQMSRCFVCAICENHHKAERLRSYLPRVRAERDTATYTIWEAARATSAAPTYFPPMEINSNRYYDGALHCNNPLDEVLEEATNEFPGAPIASILSIGTGRERDREPRGPLQDTLSSLIGRLTSTEPPHQAFISRSDFERLRDQYCRFQGDFELGGIGLAAVDKMDEIERLAEEFLRDPKVSRDIKRCARNIVQCKFS